jgi:hydroxymethylpyrimidine/phosphomethylpyrimidine kinase
MRPCVLVFSGLDPSGGAGIQADIEAIAAQGAHALPLVTALTVQDNERVVDVVPVDAGLLTCQAALLIDSMPVRAVKLGIPGNAANA